MKDESKSTPFCLNGPPLSFRYAAYGQWTNSLSFEIFLGEEHLSWNCQATKCFYLSSTSVSCFISSKYSPNVSQIYVFMYVYMYNMGVDVCLYA